MEWTVEQEWHSGTRMGRLLLQFIGALPWLAAFPFQLSSVPNTNYSIAWFLPQCNLSSCSTCVNVIDEESWVLFGRYVMP
jgi:hypothetical protein